MIHIRKGGLVRELILGIVTASLTFLLGLAITYSLAHRYREVLGTILKEDLRIMRRAIDEYAADRGELPVKLEDLIEKGYLNEVPADPLTGKRDWERIMEETEIAGKMSRGIIEVRSNAKGSGGDGISYSDY